MESSALQAALVDGAMYTVLYKRLAEFERAVDIPAQLPLPELMRHFDGALGGEKPYHLISADSRYTASLASRLLPLDELLSAEELADFAAPGLEMCRWEGRLYQLPRSVETRLLYYRSDIFDDAREQQWFTEASEGRELRVPRSWEELAAVAQYFTREGRMAGFAFPGKDAGLVAIFAEILTTVGGTFLHPDGQPGFNSPAGEWALALLRDMYVRWEAVPSDTLLLGQEEVSERFRMGRCALACDFTGTARLLCDPTFSAVAGWHGVALYPAAPEGRRAVWTGCPTFAIPADCPDPEGAVELLRFLTSPESQLLEAKNGAIPSRISVFRQVKEDLRLGTLEQLRFSLAEETLRSARLVIPALPQYWALEERLWPTLQRCVSGNLEVAEALETAASVAAGFASQAPPGDESPGYHDETRSSGLGSR